MILPAHRPTESILPWALLGGTLLGLSFPPVPAGLLAAFAFVPLLVALRAIDGYGRAFRLAWLTFGVFNLVTLYWTGGFVHAKDPYMMVAGGLLLIVHPLFFTLPVLGWMFLRVHFGFRRALAAFPFVWISFEYLHSLTQIAFPWLILGNTQTYDLAAIQMSSATGVYGVSFWLCVLNVLCFRIYENLVHDRKGMTSAPTLALLAAVAVVYVGPKIYGHWVLSGHGGSAGEPVPVRVGVVQPNIDPFEKWQENGEGQISELQQLTAKFAERHVDLVIWPETAIPFFILHPNNVSALDRLRRQVDSMRISLLAGFPDIRYYGDKEIAPKSSKVSRSGQRFDTYNSSLLLEPNSDLIQKYSKIVLVPFAERVPFSEELSLLNAMEWNFGLGGWEIGSDTTVFSFRTDRDHEVHFSNLICYESIYPGFVASFVRKGAGFLTVMTNDSWWGNTSGPYQHVQFAALRAVENRRWIVQCANGGISCFIDPFGRILKATPMFTRQTMTMDVPLHDELTFYTRHGDWFAQACLVLALFAFAAAAGTKLYRVIRSKE